jgi:hypothetical protein
MPMARLSNPDHTLVRPESAHLVSTYCVFELRTPKEAICSSAMWTHSFHSSCTILKTSVNPYYERLMLESERFFQKIELTVAVLLLSPNFLKKTPIF